MMKKNIYTALVLLLQAMMPLMAQDRFVVFENDNNSSFCISGEKQSCQIAIDNTDYDGIKIAATNLSNDLFKVTGKRPPIIENGSQHKDLPVVIVGSADRSSLIKNLIATKKLDGSKLKGHNEKFIIQTVINPFDESKKALVIAGSDQRGTIYGIYALSEQIGVSPWYFWADVPVLQHSAIYILPGVHSNGEPKVRYRGIFLNDEAPSLSGWAYHTFGGFNHQFYEKVFELILRLKGNYIWPAMWGRSFYDDDPLNGPTAQKMGIIVGTSHHEPMGRAHAEWAKYGSGRWDYTANKNTLDLFWEEGFRRMRDWEKVVTIGMRGDGDEPMSEENNIKLLQKIIANQRKTISSVSGKDASQTPQVWALYKEVQEYYDHGMRVPDDVTLLFCDDNWGNIRRLPEPGSKPRKGGYGMYYHFDYVGGPRNYKWINVTQIQRVWEQMRLTYNHGVDRMWIVNVGDLKPMEYPITFFLDMAWNPDQFTASNLLSHTVKFCEQQFGGHYPEESARLIDQYSKFNARITPELLDNNTYSIENYNEFETVTNDYKMLLLDAMKTYYLMPAQYRDAFDQLVLFPIQASANLYEMYLAVAKNHRLAKLNDPEANNWASVAQKCFDQDSLLMHHYNNTIANGKWKHMMDQVHIGYTSWQQPDKQVMPTVYFVTEDQNKNKFRVFEENNSFISMEAVHYSDCQSDGKLKWKEIPNMGKTKSAISLISESATGFTAGDKTYLEYTFDVKTPGEAKITLYLSPSLNFNSGEGLRYAIRIGDEEQIVNFNQKFDNKTHDKWLINRIIKSETSHYFKNPGVYKLRFRAMDAGIVLQKIVVDLGGVKPSFLGPPESSFRWEKIEK
jgi:hypothetical protein